MNYKNVYGMGTAELNQLMDDLDIEDCYSASCRCRELSNFCRASLGAIDDGGAEFDEKGCANLEEAIALLDQASYLILTADEYFRR